jgi:hypothetical protein
MSAFELIYKTNDIVKLLEIYKNLYSLNLFSSEDNENLADYIVVKIMYMIINKKIDIYQYELTMLLENHKYRIDYFTHLIIDINNIDDPLYIITMNIYFIDNNYKDNILLLDLYFYKFKKIIYYYDCKKLISLYENIIKLDSLIIFSYINIIYYDIINFIFSLNIENLEDLYNNHLIIDFSIFKKLHIFYDSICWICYYLIYIDNTYEIEQLCLLYYDISKYPSFLKEFCNYTRTKLKLRTFEKIIQIIFKTDYKTLQEYQYTKNMYFKLVLRNYERLLFNIFMLSYFYDEKIPNILKMKTINNLKNKNIDFIPRTDIVFLVKYVENIIINDIQENCINECQMEY